MIKLTSPKTIHNLQNKYGLTFRKRFGQNFLIDDNTVKKIADAVNLDGSETVVEIGPGIGTLTQELAQQAKKVIAVEIDRGLIPVLEETLSDFDNVEIINKDFLEMDLSEFQKSGVNLKIAANLPYYITTPIIMSLLESDLDFDQMSFLVQKEVADRLAGKPGNKDYGALSVITQYYANVTKAFDVSRNVFMPQPNVDSAVIVLKRKENIPSDLNKANYFKVVKSAFANRRKTLLNALKTNLGFSKEEIETKLNSIGIDPKQRAEKLSAEDFASITRVLFPA